jgi:hypothetical protein
MFFDLIFAVQHFILYTDRGTSHKMPAAVDEKSAAMGGADVSIDVEAPLLPSTAVGPKV